MCNNNCHDDWHSGFFHSFVFWYCYCYLLLLKEKKVVSAEYNFPFVLLQTLYCKLIYTVYMFTEYWYVTLHCKLTYMMYMFPNRILIVTLHCKVIIIMFINKIWCTSMKFNKYNTIQYMYFYPSSHSFISFLYLNLLLFKVPILFFSSDLSSLILFHSHSLSLSALSLSVCLSLSLLSLPLPLSAFVSPSSSLFLPLTFCLSLLLSTSLSLSLFWWCFTVQHSLIIYYSNTVTNNT